MPHNWIHEKIDLNFKISLNRRLKSIWAIITMYGLVRIAPWGSPRSRGSHVGVWGVLVGVPPKFFAEHFLVPWQRRSSQHPLLHIGWNKILKICHFSHFFLIFWSRQVPKYGTCLALMALIANQSSNWLWCVGRNVERLSATQTHPQTSASLIFSFK